MVLSVPCWGQGPQSASDCKTLYQGNAGVARGGARQSLVGCNGSFPSNVVHSKCREQVSARRQSSSSGVSLHAWKHRSEWSSWQFFHRRKGIGPFRLRLKKQCRRMDWRCREVFQNCRGGHVAVNGPSWVENLDALRSEFESDLRLKTYNSTTNRPQVALLFHRSSWICFHGTHRIWKRGARWRNPCYLHRWVIGCDMCILTKVLKVCQSPTLLYAFSHTYFIYLNLLSLSNYLSFPPPITLQVELSVYLSIIFVFMFCSVWFYVPFFSYWH